MDHYQTLGVTQTSTPDEIKKAYRRKAMETHPDRPGGSHEAFVAVSSAYQVLSDPEKRADYDFWCRRRAEGSAKAGTTGGRTTGSSQGASWDDLVNRWARAQQRAHQSAGRSAPPPREDRKASYDDAAKERSKRVHNAFRGVVYQHLFGVEATPDSVLKDLRRLRDDAILNPKKKAARWFPSGLNVSIGVTESGEPIGLTFWALRAITTENVGLVSREFLGSEVRVTVESFDGVKFFRARRA